MNDAWVEQIAGAFWGQAGGPPPFPRDLERPLNDALPLGVVRLPRLWVADAVAWLARRSIPCPLPAADRAMHGCLVAYDGRGFVLLDGTDPDDERRFTLAHEAAHFLLDYLRPRGRAVARLGAGIVAVFDGRRAPTAEERIDAVLAETAIGAYTHLMERRTDGAMGCGRIAGAEGRADRLALELLAPSAEVRRRLGRRDRYAETVAALAGLLVGDFGLPRAVADGYARYLARQWFGGPSARELLGLY
jgi:hypothetical protein